MTAIELISLVASIASLVLAVIAIWLSVIFYRMSTELSESTKEAAKGIGASVERLEKLFDKLYADTFSMMRDTVSDMRKHIWPEDTQAETTIRQEAENRADEKIKVLTEDVQTQLSDMLKRQRVTDERLSSMTHELGHLVETAISRSRRAEIEAREETIRDHIERAIRTLRRRGEKLRAYDIVERLRELSPDVPTSTLDFTFLLR
jgi:uncharacterized protein with von Willebrand factor type A (vWA) domain